MPLTGRGDATIIHSLWRVCRGQRPGLRMHRDAWGRLGCRCGGWGAPRVHRLCSCRPIWSSVAFKKTVPTGILTSARGFMRYRRCLSYGLHDGTMCTEISWPQFSHCQSHSRTLLSSTSQRHHLRSGPELGRTGVQSPCSHVVCPGDQPPFTPSPSRSHSENLSSLSFFFPASGGRGEAP